MKAPDKIFMPNELLSEEWQRHIEGQDTAYIRKDALLEWLKEQYKHIDKLPDKYSGQMVAFQQVIDKLNSM